MCHVDAWPLFELLEALFLKQHINLVFKHCASEILSGVHRKQSSLSRALGRHDARLPQEPSGRPFVPESWSGQQNVRDGNGDAEVDERTVDEGLGDAEPDTLAQARFRQSDADWWL